MGTPTHRVKPTRHVIYVRLVCKIRAVAGKVKSGPMDAIIKKIPRDLVAKTVRRVAKAFREYFSGYDEDPAEALSRTFEEVGGYDDIVMLRDIEFNSHCEHHIAPFIGRVHVAYLPMKRVVGISKLARVVEIFARRLQTQETMTAQIANAIMNSLQPRGVAVLIEAVHTCMSMRGVGKRNVATITTQFAGEFKTEPVMQARFMELVRSPSNGFSL